MKQMPVESFFFALGRPISSAMRRTSVLCSSPTGKKRFGELRLVQPVQKIALVFAGVQALEQLVQPGGRLRFDARWRSGPWRFFLRPERMAWSRNDLNLISALHKISGLGVRPGLVFAHKLSKHAVFVVSGKVHMLYLYAQHVGHGGGVDKIHIAGAVGAVVITGSGWAIVVFPVLHEDANDLVALLF